MAALVTAAQVASECINDTHFDSTYIKDGYILAAQLEYIKPYLGDDFYDALIASSEDYAALTAYLYPALKWFAYYKALPFIQMRTTNQGVASFGSDYASNISYNQFADFKQNALTMAQSYLDECTRFLNDNSSDYPLWKRQEQTKFGGIIMYDSLEDDYNENNSFYKYEDND